MLQLSEATWNKWTSFLLLTSHCNDWSEVWPLELSALSILGSGVEAASGKGKRSLLLFKSPLPLPIWDLGWVGQFTKPTVYVALLGLKQSPRFPPPKIHYTAQLKAPQETGELRGLCLISILTSTASVRGLTGPTWSSLQLPVCVCQSARNLTLLGWFIFNVTGCQCKKQSSH